jgi:hypothetical protein
MVWRVLWTVIFNLHFTVDYYFKYHRHHLLRLILFVIWVYTRLPLQESGPYNDCLMYLLCTRGCPRWCKLQYCQAVWTGTRSIQSRSTLAALHSNCWTYSFGFSSLGFAGIAKIQFHSGLCLVKFWIDAPYLCSMKLPPKWLGSRKLCNWSTHTPYLF